MKARGDQAESKACSFLESKGLRLVERNFRTRFGELDLIMQEGNTTVFVEVRMRSTRSHGSAAESVSLHKQRKLIQCAQLFLAQKRITSECRFDVIALEGETQNKIEWLRGAFDTSTSGFAN